MAFKCITFVLNTKVKELNMANEHQNTANKDTYSNLTLHLLKAKRLRISVYDRLVADITCL